MGLFSQQFCPICGNKIGFFNFTKIQRNKELRIINNLKDTELLNTKIQNGISLCYDCISKIDMDQLMIPFQSINDIKKHLQYKEDNLKQFQNFKITQEVKIDGHNPYLRRYFFREDDKMKMWYVSPIKNPTNPILFKYDDIVDYELIEDNETSIKSGGVGRAIIGSALFGGVGAIVGSTTRGYDNKNIVKSISVKISMKNEYRKNIVINWSFGKGKKPDSLFYKTYRAQAEYLISFLDSLIKKADNISNNTNNVNINISIADELVKYKELLDKGILTKEEFTLKKKELLKL